MNKDDYYNATISASALGGFTPVISSFFLLLFCFAIISLLYQTTIILDPHKNHTHWRILKILFVRSNALLNWT